MNATPLVTILCMTYNHAPYIEDAMNGFCMQQTDFPFVAIIVDDASTDGEPDVIKRYLDQHFNMLNARQWETDEAHFIEAQHLENKSCWFAVVFLKYNFWQAKKQKNPLFEEWNNQVKYIALCEGDDYWTDCTKLQRQVDFLENDSKYSMCYSGFTNVDENGIEIFRDRYERMIQESNSGDLLNHLLRTNFILTCTTIFRKNIYLEYLNLKFNYKHDYTLFLYASIKGLCYFFPDKMAAYRQIKSGMMATHKEQISRMFHETRLYFYNDILDNNVIAKKRLSSDVKKTIATICIMQDSKEFQKRYIKILKHKVLWKYIPLLIAKKIYINVLSDYKNIWAN